MSHPTGGISILIQKNKNWYCKFGKIIIPIGDIFSYFENPVGIILTAVLSKEK